MRPPLEGLLVVDFSQFLAGPYASLRLLDMGARVIKVENPDGGDLCRHHYLSDTEIDGDSTLFHAINRGKQSIALDLKNVADLKRVRSLVKKADVVIQNFRPGVIERLGLDYNSVKRLNPDIIYGSISGYGNAGEWATAPGQDLLAQARSGAMWLSGNADDGPVPFGIPLADISAGANLTQGILGALYRRATSGEGALVETSLLESLIDLQFELLTNYSNNGGVLPKRLPQGSAHGYLAAPYGVYKTADGHLALAMTRLPVLAAVLKLPSLLEFSEFDKPEFTARDALQSIVQDRLLDQSAVAWEEQLTKQGIWCARILEWPELIDSEIFQNLDILSNIPVGSLTDFKALRTPIRLDGSRAEAQTTAPQLNADHTSICVEFEL